MAQNTTPKTNNVPKTSSVNKVTATTTPEIIAALQKQGYEFSTQYNRYSKNWTAYGRFMYRLCYNWGLFLDRPSMHWLFYVLTYTWGIITTVIGLFLSLVLLITGHQPHAYYEIWYFQIFDWWGGFEMGPMFVRDKKSSDSHINPHEYGHCFAQSSLLGPFMLILVSIPSATRYWIQEFRDRRNLRLREQGRIDEIRQNPDYDNIWFEACATDIGTDLARIRNYRQIQKTKANTVSTDATTDTTTDAAAKATAKVATKTAATKTAAEAAANAHATAQSAQSAQSNKN